MFQIIKNSSNKKQVDCDPEYFGVDGDIYDGDGMMVGQTFDGMYDHDHDHRVRVRFRVALAGSLAATMIQPR